MVVVYLDLTLLLNSFSDIVALYITAHLSGVSLRWSRAALAALLGGVYGMLVMLPSLDFLRGAIPQLLAAAFMIRLVFGKQTCFLRLLILFFVLSCTMGGTVFAFLYSLSENSIAEMLQKLNWQVFILVGVSCYLVLSIVFRADAKHQIKGQVCCVSVTLCGRTVKFDALYDTGNTLRDPYTGRPVLVVWYDALRILWGRETWSVIERLEKLGSVRCVELLASSSDTEFCLVPYRAVGIGNALLAAFRADLVTIDHKQYKDLLIVLSPTQLSDGGGYAALWGGERSEGIEVGT